MATPEAEAAGGRQRALGAYSPVDYMSITSFPRLPEEEAGGAAEGGLRSRKEEDAFLGEQDTGEGRRPGPGPACSRPRRARILGPRAEGRPGRPARRPSVRGLPGDRSPPPGSGGAGQHCPTATPRSRRVSSLRPAGLRHTAALCRSFSAPSHVPHSHRKRAGAALTARASSKCEAFCKGPELLPAGCMALIKSGVLFMLVKTFSLFLIYYFLVNSPESCFFPPPFHVSTSNRAHCCMRSPRTPPRGGFHSPKFFLVCTPGHSSLLPGCAVPRACSHPDRWLTEEGLVMSTGA